MFRRLRQGAARRITSISSLVEADLGPVLAEGAMTDRLPPPSSWSSAKELVEISLSLRIRLRFPLLLLRWTVAQSLGEYARGKAHTR